MGIDLEQLIAYDRLRQFRKFLLSHVRFVELIYLLWRQSRIQSVPCPTWSPPAPVEISSGMRGSQHKIFIRGRPLVYYTGLYDEYLCLNDILQLSDIIMLETGRPKLDLTVIRIGIVRHPKNMSARHLQMNFVQR